MHSEITLRKLQQSDALIWREIRLEALKMHPESFGGSFEEESVLTDQEFSNNLVKSDIFGAFVDNTLVGVAGFFRLGPQKLRHRGTLFSMYLKKEFRHRGIADLLLKEVIRHAQKSVLQLHCTVETSNTAAIHLYQKHGFKIYGTEPCALKVGGSFFDEHLMVLLFDVPNGPLLD